MIVSDSPLGQSGASEGQNKTPPKLSLSGFWPGPAPDFPSLAPESTSEDDYYFRCPDCRNLVAVGRWLRDGMYFECDVAGCFGQFYAALDVGANVDREHTPRGRSGGPSERPVD